MPRFTSDNQPKRRGRRGQSKFKALAIKLEQNEEALAAKLMELALEGDPQALKLCIERMNPTPKATLPPLEGCRIQGESLSDKARSIIELAGRGAIAPDVAASLMNSITGAARAIETDEILRRLDELEAKQ